MKCANALTNSISLTRCVFAAILVRATSRRFTERFALGARTLFFTAGIFLAAISLGRAATIAWTNTAGGTWNTAANWTPNQVPDAGDDALITSNGTYTVTLDVSPTIASLTLGG